MKITIVYSNPSKRISSTNYGETDSDTSIIARAVAKGLKENGFDLDILPVYEDTIASISDIKTDCIFNLIEWCGLDISLAREAFYYLRKIDIPVTGSSEKAYVLTGDKIAMKKELAEANIQVPQGVGFLTGKEPIPKNLRYPLIVKPSTEHCSIGLGPDAIANDKKELRSILVRQIFEYGQPALAEEFIKGREFEVYLLEEKNKISVLPIEEVVFNRDQELLFQTYKAKWVDDSVDYLTTDVTLAEINEKDRKVMEETCVRAFTRLGLRGYSRVDLRFRDGVPYILEANANPSVYDDSEELKDPKKEIIWGIKFSEYVKAIVDSALYHHERGDKV